MLFAFRELLDAHREELAAIDHPRARQGARRRAWRGRSAVSRSSSSPAACRELLKGELAARSRAASTPTRLRQPLGVVAGITPFNFPVMVPLWMYADRHRVRQRFVLKPSEQDPSASLRLAELCAEAGLPDGVFNVVHGDKEAVDALLDPPRRRRGLVRRLDAGRPPRLRDGTRARQARPGARRRQEPRGRPARRRPRARRRRPRRRRPTARPGERCMAVSVAVAVGDVRRPARRRRSRERIAALVVGDGTEPSRHGPARDARAHRDKVAALHRRGRRGGRRAAGRRPRAAVEGRERRPLPRARPCSTT